jgi:hypothetical protein
MTNLPISVRDYLAKKNTFTVLQYLSQSQGFKNLYDVDSVDNYLLLPGGATNISDHLGLRNAITDQFNEFGKRETDGEKYADILKAVNAPAVTPETLEKYQDSLGTIDQAGAQLAIELRDRIGAGLTFGKISLHGHSKN